MSDGGASRTRFGGRVALVTGAGSGIGRATAVLLAEQGARLVLNDIDAAALAETVATLGPDADVRHRCVVGDVAEESTAGRMVAVAERELGGVDIVVGGVGVMHVRDVDDVTVDEFDRVMATNVRGMFLLCRHAVPALLRGSSGAIVLVTSTSAFRGQEFGGVSSFLYNTSKAAVRQLATSLATRYAAEGLRVNAVAPGVVRTHQLSNSLPGVSRDEEQETFTQAGQTVPIGRAAEPAEVARAIAFLASDDASYVTGTTLVVDGGLLAA